MYGIQVEQLKAFLEEMKTKKKFDQTDLIIPEGGFHGNGKRPGDAHKETDGGSPQAGVEGDDAPSMGMRAQGGDVGNLQNLANAAHGGEYDGARVLARGDAMSFKKRIIRIKPQTPADASPARDCR